MTSGSLPLQARFPSPRSLRCLWNLRRQNIAAFFRCSQHIVSLVATQSWIHPLVQVQFTPYHCWKLPILREAPLAYIIWCQTAQPPGKSTMLRWYPQCSYQALSKMLGLELTSCPLSSTGYLCTFRSFFWLSNLLVYFCHPSGQSLPTTKLHLSGGPPHTYSNHLTPFPTPICTQSRLPALAATPLS